uniref:Uncharacterized protein n=1 Tax=Rhizophagus irregularis (strain DAOM 181602 / DAOM 197198 / MUCL 43194) TaxID=747089 RepID=U9SXX0_RHIID
MVLTWKAKELMTMMMTMMYWRICKKLVSVSVRIVSLFLTALGLHKKSGQSRKRRKFEKRRKRNKHLPFHVQEWINRKKVFFRS